MKTIIALIVVSLAATVICQTPSYPVLPLFFSAYVTITDTNAQYPAIGMMWYDYIHGMQRIDLKTQDGSNTIFTVNSNYTSQKSATYYQGNQFQCGCLPIEHDQTELDVNTSYDYIGTQTIGGVVCDGWLNSQFAETLMTTLWTNPAPSTGQPSLVQYNITTLSPFGPQREVITTLSHVLPGTIPASTWVLPSQCNC
eukprot:gene7339-8545_t